MFRGLFFISMREGSKIFAVIAKKTAQLMGHPAAFISATGLVVLWLLSGPLFGFSDTWQLIINTSTTIITFLMVFLIQSTQNQDTIAIQIKLDELIRSHELAHNAMMDLEELSEKELQEIRLHYEKLAETARSELRERKREENKNPAQ